MATLTLFTSSSFMTSQAAEKTTSLQQPVAIVKTSEGSVRLEL